MKSFIIKSTRTFSEKSFSKITTEEEFREYAHNVMKKAHGDEYSEEVTNKVVDDLIKDNPDADYGELIGRLTSGFGDKSFASSKTGYIGHYVHRYPNGTEKLEQLIIKAGPGEDPYQILDEKLRKKSESNIRSHKYGHDYIAERVTYMSDKSFSDTEVGTVTIKTSNPKKLGELIQMIKDHGNVGHSFECRIDTNGDNPEDWSWDGDGSDRIGDIEIEDIVRESRTFSIAEDREFAHGRGYKSRQLEVKRLQDLYNDVKSKQKDGDPSQKLRNRMLLQEIKVKLEEARYEFYKHAFEESRS